MTRFFVVLVGIIAALGVGFVALTLSDPLNVLKAIGVGVAVLVLVTALGLADLIDLAHSVGEAVQTVQRTAVEVVDEVKRLRHTLRDLAAVDENQSEESASSGARTGKQTDRGPGGETSAEQYAPADRPRDTR